MRNYFIDTLDHYRGLVYIVLQLTTLPPTAIPDREKTANNQLRRVTLHKIKTAESLSQQAEYYTTVICSSLLLVNSVFSDSRKNYICIQPPFYCNIQFCYTQFRGYRTERARAKLYNEVYTTQERLSWDQIVLFCFLCIGEELLNNGNKITVANFFFFFLDSTTPERICM